ncbi:hypothetical protein BHF68_02000 [Desulfuribacillus alkaliarsenatis]|uniref:Cytochrome c domain-containing protein n=1 Tax=Desulfuribacillus alkaliarsenatis TaxID=766136 RepID=A0A1E5G5K6_9FIRM|nr:hypothetical protein BHF68_02000 [Desulfuribacillus alkaliarsenatis]
MSSSSIYQFAGNNFYPVYKSSAVDIMEFNSSKFCLKDYASEERYLTGEALYKKNCIFCHTTNMDGDLDLLSLNEVVKRLGQDNITSVVKNGRGEMPVYGFVLSDEEIKIISLYLTELYKKAQ